MAHHAKIIFKEQNREYTIVDINYTATQDTNANYRPTKHPKISPITMILVSPDNSDLFFYEWMNNLKDWRNCTIQFRVVNKGKTTAKTLVLDRAHPISIKENFNFHDDKQMTITVTLCCFSTIFISGEKHLDDQNKEEKKNNVVFWIQDKPKEANTKKNN
jgi:hypothetical protein